MNKTPEERFDRIEQLLQTTAEQQIRNTQDIDKHNEAIRSLIVVGRTCLDSMKDMGERLKAAFQELRELKKTNPLRQNAYS